jgi:hypothetical protein
MSRASFRAGEAALISFTFQRGRRHIPSLPASSGLSASPPRPFPIFRDSPDEGAWPRLQKEQEFQSGKRSAFNAGQTCAGGMYRAVFTANENKSASGEKNNMIDLRKRR